MFWPFLGLELLIYVLLYFLVIELHDTVHVMQVVDRGFSSYKTSLVWVDQVLVFDLALQLLEEDEFIKLHQRW